MHGYDETPDASVGLVEQVRAIMNANGDAAVPIWMTEVGWATAGRPSRFTTDLAGQAADIDSLLAQLVARHEELNMRGVIEYMWHDASPQTDVTQTWDYHLGLVYQDYTHKPSYDAFQARALETTPPDTALQSEPPDRITPGPQSVAFGSSEAGSDFECALDGGSWTRASRPRHRAAARSETAQLRRAGHRPLREHRSEPRRRRLDRGAAAAPAAALRSRRGRARRPPARSHARQASP